MHTQRDEYREKMEKDAWTMEAEERRDTINQKNIQRLAENVPKLVKNNKSQIQEYLRTKTT